MTKDDDPQLLRDLRNLGADYEPDVAAIRRRVRTGEPTEPVGPFIVPLGSLGADPFGPADRLRLVPDPGSAPVGVRSGRAVLLPAAAVLLLFGGVVLAGSLGRTDPDSTATSVPIWTAVPTTSVPARATATAAGPIPSPDPSLGPSRTRSAAGTPSAERTATRPATPTTTRTGAAAASPVKVSVLAAVQAGTAVDLSRPPLLDWLAAGTRSDLKQVRAKSGTEALGLDQPGSATSIDGPFSTSWTAGLPEQSHDDATGWLKAEGRAGLTVTIAESSEPRTVLLYAGTQDLQGTISISGPGITPGRTALDPATATPAGFVITATLPPTTGPTKLQLAGAPDGPSPSVYLAAVTLS